MIEDQLVSLAQGDLHGIYGSHVVNEIRDLLANKMDLKGKYVLTIMIGSETPWLEVCALVAGAANVVTLEYTETESTHPKI